MAVVKVDVLVIGSINMDLVVGLQRAPIGGETVLGRDLHTYPGGKGANQAVAAARLGARVAMVGRVGDDAHGRELLAGLGADGVAVGAVAALADVPTGTAVIFVEDGGENRIVVVPGANSRLMPADLDPEWFASARVVLVSQEIAPQTVAEALRLGRQAGCVTVLNPAPARPILDEVLAQVQVLTPNRSELALLTGRAVQTVAEATEGAEQLLARGVGAVVVTLGSQGALTVQDGQVEHVPAFAVTPADTTAAGDAFCGALATGLAHGETLLASARYAVAAAAIAVTRPGAQPSLATAAEVAEFLAKRR